ncbi:MAG: MauE/DoxX family redox-associated membrane protein [Gammaproteobacteria bacterium]
MDPILSLIIRMGLSILFATAAVSKLRNRRDFYAAMLAYQLLPPRWAMSLADILPWAEAAIATGLILDVNGALPAAASLLLIYALAMAVNLARGRRDLDCGCGGAPQPLNVWLVGRNLLLAGAALAGSFSPAGSLTWKPVDALIVASAVSVLALIYVSSHRILAKRTGGNRK